MLYGREKNGFWSFRDFEDPRSMSHLPSGSLFVQIADQTGLALWCLPGHKGPGSDAFSLGR